MIRRPVICGRVCDNAADPPRSSPLPIHPPIPETTNPGTWLRPSRTKVNQGQSNPNTARLACSPAAVPSSNFPRRLVVRPCALSSLLSVHMPVITYLMPLTRITRITQTHQNTPKHRKTEKCWGGGLRPPISVLGPLYAQVRSSLTFENEIRVHWRLPPIIGFTVKKSTPGQRNEADQSGRILSVSGFRP